MSLVPLKSPEKSPKAALKPDERLFLRLGQEHRWLGMSPHFLKTSLADKLVNYGYAVSTVGEIMRNTLLTQAHRR
ncbi:putative eka-like protein [Golovinomyces cichoracearum]|uniref:Putative eka-like protein n=1 Tax=Golovinomyces cichoracearum TaxID=62708 RepID=A0A420J8D4_9PEZI|nr:putative eka-like protein [Golovinomyces cichoracearum]